jgi:hypothetical protein
MREGESSDQPRGTDQVKSRNQSPSQPFRSR